MKKLLILPYKLIKSQKSINLFLEENKQHVTPETIVVICGEVKPPKYDEKAGEEIIDVEAIEDMSSFGFIVTESFSSLGEDYENMVVDSLPFSKGESYSNIEKAGFLLQIFSIHLIDPRYVTIIAGNDSDSELLLLSKQYYPLINVVNVAN